MALRIAGYEVVGLTRTPPPPERTVAEVSYVIGDVVNGEIPYEAFAGCGHVIHLVGIIAEARGKGQTFSAVHVGGTRNVLRAMDVTAVPGRFIYLSAQGASPDSSSAYSRTKAQAEQLIRASNVECVIFRPSVVIGPNGDFVQQMEQLIQRPPLSPFALPFIPVPGSGKNKFQPVAIDDLTTSIIASLESPAAENAVIAIGGADRVTFNELIQAIANRIHVEKRLLHIPMPLMYVGAAVLEAALPTPPITVDQLKNLGVDNVCNNNMLTEMLGVTPRTFEAALDEVYGKSGKAAPLTY